MTVQTRQTSDPLVPPAGAPVRLVIEVDPVTGRLQVTGTVVGDHLHALGLLEAAKFALLQAASHGAGTPHALASPARPRVALPT